AQGQRWGKLRARLPGGELRHLPIRVDALHRGSLLFQRGTTSTALAPGRWSRAIAAQTKSCIHDINQPGRGAARTSLLVLLLAKMDAAAGSSLPRSCNRTNARKQAGNSLAASRTWSRWLRASRPPDGECEAQPRLGRPPGATSGSAGAE